MEKEVQKNDVIGTIHKRTRGLNERRVKEVSRSQEN
jgi:hypothetical protein